MAEENEVIKDVIKIGDKVFDKDSITPSIYFDYVKGMKQTLNRDEYDIIIDSTLNMIKKTQITGQTAMAAELTHQLELALRELDAANKGFDVFVDRKDLEKYIRDVEAKSIKLIELSNYQREIPDEVLDKLLVAKEIFDEIYVVFTDYTLKETKKVAKKRRDKDPVLFGAFKDSDEGSEEKIYVEDRLFFIADWVEENCDLTLEQIARDVKKKDKKDITYKASIPEDAEQVKKLLNSFKTKNIEEQLEPVNLFQKIKRKVTTRKRKKKEEAKE